MSIIWPTLVVGIDMMSPVPTQTDMACRMAFVLRSMFLLAAIHVLLACTLTLVHELWWEFDYILRPPLTGYLTYRIHSIN